jgi:hypothetical protein
MRGLINTVPDATPEVWQRFLGIHLAGLSAAGASAPSGTSSTLRA